MTFYPQSQLPVVSPSGSCAAAAPPPPAGASNFQATTHGSASPASWPNEFGIQVGGSQTSTDGGIENDVSSNQLPNKFTYSRFGVQVGGQQRGASIKNTVKANNFK